MRGKCRQITLVSFTQNSHLFAGRKLGSEWILWHQNFQILELSSWAHKRQRLFFFFSASHCCASSCWLFILDYLFIKFIIISQTRTHRKNTSPLDYHLYFYLFFYFVLILNFIFAALLALLLLLELRTHSPTEPSRFKMREWMRIGRALQNEFLVLYSYSTN